MSNSKIYRADAAEPKSCRGNFNMYKNKMLKEKRLVGFFGAAPVAPALSGK
jgi:hypothetical protein